ncbi:Peptidylprolyl isomerase [Alkalilimnicola ehrlichii MLHE-1]|uniref:Peptidyl-prolyl cis-trans isomerase n=2 Tax=Alkalilimnicola ehrlichii TaxID=351052 RepID=Q0AA61_ALKEH|nr:Peptidylprolyl isomerase [Alkalilimnicola ehrlichii MLHE-1]
MALRSAHKLIAFMLFVIFAVLLVVGAKAVGGERDDQDSQHAQMETPMVVFETSHGNLTLELFPDEAPITVENFLQYVDDGFYDGTIFHRVIPGFVVQGGGFDEEFRQKETRAPIKNEADNGLRNERGTLSMARTQQKDSATSQFFINLADNAFLDHGTRDFGYAVFARVAEGMEVVDKIAQVRTGNRGMHQDVPVEDIVVKRAYRQGDD